jgi:hypothetical protein
MFHISRAFFSITQFLSLHVDPTDKENPGPAAPPEDEPMHVSLLDVSGAEKDGLTGIRGITVSMVTPELPATLPLVVTPCVCAVVAVLSLVVAAEAKHGINRRDIISVFIYCFHQKLVGVCQPIGLQTVSKT